MNKLAVLLCLALTALAPRVRAAGQRCEQLVQLALPDTTVTAAELVPAGAFTPPQETTP
jgi:hypothetical protein